MDIRTEKAEVLKQFELVNDLSLIRAIKNLLDFGLNTEIVDDKKLEESINRGFEESENNDVTSHDLVMKEFRSKYSK